MMTSGDPWTPAPHDSAALARGSAAFGGGVAIVEGLTNLDQLQQPVVEFIALPLRIADGDGSPVRAIAIEESSS